LGGKKNQSQLGRFLVTLRTRGVVFRGSPPADSDLVLATQKKTSGTQGNFLSDFQYSFISFCERNNKLLSIRMFGLIVSLHPYCV